MLTDFKGDETASDVLRAVLDDFSLSDSRIVYENDIPYLVTAYEELFEAKFRVDRMLLDAFPRCVQLCDLYAERGILKSEDRSVMARSLAYVCMTAMLIRMTVLEHKLFHENAEDDAFVAPAILLHNIARVYEHPETPSLKTALRTTIQKNLTTRLRVANKDKREYLTGFLNSLPLIELPTSAGRPVGSTKPEEKKREEAMRFRVEIEAAIKKLFIAHGKMPTKTAVAQLLQSGGVNPKTGTDSRLSVFTTKLKRMKLDYDEIAKQAQGDLSNNAR
jgi:hypothetical protein